MLLLALTTASCALIVFSPWPDRPVRVAVMANDRATFETVIEADAAKGNQIAMPRSVLANGDIELLIGDADDVEWLRLPRPATP